MYNEFYGTLLCVKAPEKIHPQWQLMQPVCHCLSSAPWQTSSAVHCGWGGHPGADEELPDVQPEVPLFETHQRSLSDSLSELLLLQLSTQVGQPAWSYKREHSEGPDANQEEASAKEQSACKSQDSDITASSDIKDWTKSAQETPTSNVCIWLTNMNLNLQAQKQFQMCLKTGSLLCSQTFDDDKQLWKVCSFSLK